MKKSFLNLNLWQVLAAIGTFIIYTQFLSWQTALVIMIGIGFHEYSHLWAASRLGLSTGGFYFIPFVGGAALIQGEYKKFTEQATVVLMGPVGGTLLVIPTILLYYFTGNQIIGAAAEWMILINLFNLLPLSILDGGQLMDTLTYSFSKTLGFVCNALSTIVAIVFLYKLNYLLSILVLILNGPRVIAEYNDWKNYRNGDTWKCSDRWLYPPAALSHFEKALVVSCWIATIAILLYCVYIMRQTPVDMFILFPKKS